MLRNQHTNFLWLLVPLIATAAGIFASAPADTSPSRHTFAARADVVSVDVVVVDKDGRPIHGLTAGDFTVREDGRPQAIVAFEEVALGGPEARAELASGDASADAARVAANDTARATAPGRTLGLLVDDLGLDLRGRWVLDGLVHWIRKGTAARDELTLMTSSGHVEWRGQAGAGRAELLHAIGRIRCLRPPDIFFGVRNGVGPVLDEWKSYLVVSGGDQGLIQALENRPALTSPHAGEANTHTAREVYEWWYQRSQGLLAAVTSFSNAYAAERGRKTILVVTQSFIRENDTSQFDVVLEAAHRAHVALYFLDPRGILPGSMAFDLAGAEYLARQTGGVVMRNKNDVADGLAQIVDEASNYYLIGYAPPGLAADGDWHDLKVRVARKGVTVRARRGYFAPKKPKDRGSRKLRPGE